MTGYADEKYHNVTKALLRVIGGELFVCERRIGCHPHQLDDLISI